MQKTTWLEPSAMLDFRGPAIQRLITSGGWLKLDQYGRIGAAYDYVRNQVPFGYNRADTLTASQVLADGYGQCNTKATLLMALLRALSVACRLHGFTIHKQLQRGVVPEPFYTIAPDHLLHSWVEVRHNGRWIDLEGFILDQGFLGRLQESFGGGTDSLCGYGAGTDSLSAPEVGWCGKDTYIQKTGISRDFGVFDTPDAFYARHRQDFPFWKEWLFRYLVRHWMNARVRRIRAGFRPARLPEHSHEADIRPSRQV